MRTFVLLAALLFAGAAVAEVTIGFLATQPSATRPTPGGLEREVIARKKVGEGNVRFDYRFAEGNPGRLSQLARELVDAKPAVLFCADFNAVRAAAEVTSTVPIVFVAHVDPVEHRFLTSLRSSNRNLTGLTTFRPVLVKMVEVALDAFPDARRVAMLLDMGELAARSSVEPMHKLAAQRGATVSVHDVGTASELDAFLAGLSRNRPDVVVVSTSAATWQHRQRLVAALGRASVPALYESEVFITAGGLMSYGPSYVDVLPRVTEYVERVAAGELPSSLPILQPTKIELLVNLRAAREQGITVHRSVVVRADRVME